MVIMSLEETRRSRQTRQDHASTPVEPPQHVQVDHHDPSGVGVAVVVKGPDGEARIVPGEAGEAHPARTAEQQLIEDLRSELDDYFVGMRTLNSLPPDEVYRWLSGVSARLCEIRAKLWRSESRRLAALRSREVDPLIEECDRQFKYHSRLQASSEFEWQMTRGAPS